MPVFLAWLDNHSGFIVPTLPNSGEYSFFVYSTLGLGLKGCATTGLLRTNNPKLTAPPNGWDTLHTITDLIGISQGLFAWWLPSPEMTRVDRS